MYLWRKRISPGSLTADELALQSEAGDRLAIIEQSGKKRLVAEVACDSRKPAEHLKRKFGGTVEKLPRDWLRRFSRAQKSKSLKVGKRLIVSRSGGLPSAVHFKSTAGKPSFLVIPASAAFGTGDHATTAMSLRMIERLIVRSPKLVVDIGTGSGILALAASRFGAKRVVGIDLDPMAISIAKQNARLNKIDNVKFRIADVLRWKLPRKIDILTANLFSELLISILPKLKLARWLILSGVMRKQESGLVRALKRHRIDIVEIRRRGKWIAVLAGGDK